MTAAAVALFVLGTLVTGVNLWVSIVHPLLLRSTHKSVKRKSGFPLVGSLCLWVAACLLYPSGLAYWALAISLADIGGPHWFLGSVLCHSLFRARPHDKT